MNLRIATGSLEHPHILTLSYARRSKQHPDMITLHARYDDWMKRFIPGAIYITLVRHPLSRAISHFAHFNPISRNMTFNEFYRQFVSEKERLPRRISNRHRDNLMATFLGFHKEDELSEERLQKRFSIVGITEHFNESMILLQQALRWPNDSMVYASAHLNPNRPNSIISKEIRQIFEQRNALDFKLYNLSLRLFRRKWNNLPRAKELLAAYQMRLKDKSSSPSLIKEEQQRKLWKDW